MSSGAVGATRSRTELFLKYRGQARGTNGKGLGVQPSSPSKQIEKGTHRLLEAAVATTIDIGSTGDFGSAGIASVLPPQYVDFKEQARTEMQVIKQKMGELRQAHARAALTTFDETNASEAEVEVVTQDITRRFRKIEKNLQHFGSNSTSSEADEKVKQNVQRTLASELQKLSLQFRKQQKAYLTRLQQNAGGAGTSFASLDDSGRPEEEFDTGFNELQMAKADTHSALAQERASQIQSILQSINDLAQIMKDLSVLVIDQGTILDRIDYNIEQVAVKVEEGVKQLEKAESKQKQSRSILCIMFLGCAVVVMLLIVIFKNLIQLAL